MCEVCCLSDRDRLPFLELELDGWLPCDFIKLDATYAVTARLCEQILAAGLQGASLRRAAVRPSEFFHAEDSDEPLPDTLFQLDIDAIVPGPSGWWTYDGDCEACGRARWSDKDGTGAAIAGNDGAPWREVFRRNWSGQDFFWTNDPGPPLITARVKKILDGMSTPELVLGPARFV